jgi:GT2 family glycosyltransferase
VDEVDKGQFDSLKEVQFITGCLMCFDIKVVQKVGYWDPSYFLYYEDSDYCVRAAQKGVKIMYDPSIKLWHKNGQITDGPGSVLHKKYQEKNRVVFGLKYAPLRTKLHLLKNAITNSFAK